MSPLDELRNIFRQSLGDYIHEGNSLRDLLLAAKASASPGSGMSEQQARLTDARSRYELARSNYVEAVLAGTILPESADE